MDLLHNGVDRAVIGLWLGHESVETTSVYLLPARGPEAQGSGYGQDRSLAGPSRAVPAR